MNLGEVLARKADAKPISAYTHFRLPIFQGHGSGSGGSAGPAPAILVLLCLLVVAIDNHINYYDYDYDCDCDYDYYGGQSVGAVRRHRARQPLAPRR